MIDTGDAAAGALREADRRCPGLACAGAALQLPGQFDHLRDTGGAERVTLGTPDDIALAVEFFFDPAASYVTGQTLYVCGGRSLSSPSV